MKKEQLANIISYLESIKEKDGDYKKYLDSLDLLTKRLIDYYTPNLQGKYMNMTLEEYEEIDTLFKDCIEKSNFFLQTEFADEKNEYARDIKKTVTQRLHKDLLTDFYEEYKNLKLDTNKPFYEQIQKPKKMEEIEQESVIDNDVAAKEENKEDKKEEKKENNKEVGDISASKIYTDGLFQKDNMVVNYGNEKISGTFIYKTNYNPDEEIDRLINEYVAKYPEYKDYFLSLRDIESLNELNDINNEELLDEDGKIANFFNGKNLKASETSKFNEYKNQQNFLNANAEFILKLRPVLKEINDYSINLKAKNETNLDRRNVAVTGISKMLDHPEVIPNARAVAIENDNNGQKSYFEGTFIEDAKGKTINEFGLNDSVHTSKLEDWDTVEAKKALANLQIIDYICGNKRDVNNIKFEFDPKTNKLIGVQGINNEKSFFTPNVKPLIIGEEDYSEIEKIKVIDGEMATKIMAIDEAEFNASMLQYGLNETEVSEAWRRLSELKEVISNPKILDEKDNTDKLFKEEKFIIVNGDEAWKNLNLQNLKTKDNIFSKVIDAQKELTNEAKVDKTLIENYNILKSTYINKILDGDKFLEEAKRNAPLFGTSRRYTNIIKGLNDYNNTTKPEEKAEKLDKLQQLVDIYKTEKEDAGAIDKYGNPLKNLSGKDLGRVNLVNKLDTYLKKTKEFSLDVQNAYDKKEENENKVEEFNATYRLGKYKNYAKLYKNEKDQILINANILEREKQINNILVETSKQMVSFNNGVDLDKSPVLKQKYELCKNYIDTTIKNSKEQLLNDYHHGTIPKEYFDYKNQKYDKKIFDFKEEEKLFAYENPESKIFKNNFQDKILNDINKDLLEEENMMEMKDIVIENEPEMQEMEDLSNKN